MNNEGRVTKEGDKEGEEMEEESVRKKFKRTHQGRKKELKMVGTRANEKK